MNTQDLHEKRTKLLHDAQQIILAAKKEDGLTPEQRSTVDKMLADVDVLEADIETNKRLDAFATENRSSNSIPRSIDGSSIRVTTEEERSKIAFDAYIRGNNQNVNLSSEVRSRFAEVETRDLVTSGTGANFIPQAFYPQLFEAQKAWGDLLNLVNVVNTDDGAPLKYATSNDTTAVMYEETEGSADGNGAEDPVLSGALISSIGLSTPPVLVSWAQLQDSNFSIDSFVQNILGERYFRTMSSMIVNGSTSGTVGSLLAGIANASPVTSASNAAVTYTDIANLYGGIDPAYVQTSTFAMNSTTRATLLGEVNTLGNPIFTPSASVTADPFGSLLGRPVSIVQALPNIGAGNYPILFGDFKKGYTLRVVKPGLSVVILKERYADLFCTGYVPYVRAGGAFISGINNPLKGLKIHA